MSQFYNFGIIHNSEEFVHLTCKMQLLYLVKYRPLVSSSMACVV